MMPRRGWLAALGLLGGLLGGAPAEAKPVIVLPRPGQVGIGLQGQYGTMINQGSLGSDFGVGPGLAVRVRYRMRYERALGFSFERQSFDVRTVQPPDSIFAPRRLTLISSGIEFYKLFGTRTRTTQMLSVGLGLAQVSQTLNGGETLFPNDGVYVSAGGGVERFFWSSWAWDLSARYLAVFQDGSTNHDLQAALGLIFYASY